MLFIMIKQSKKSRLLLTLCVPQEKNTIIFRADRIVWLFRLSYSFMYFRVFFYHCVYVGMFCILLLNSVSYVFLLLCMLCSVYIVFNVPTGTLRPPWLRVFHAFSSVIRQMPGYNSQRRGTAHTLPKLIVSFCVLFVRKCVLYCCHRVSTQLQFTNISYSNNIPEELTLQSLTT